MSSTSPTPRDCSEVPAVDADGSACVLLLRSRKIEETARRGSGPAHELGYTVPWAVKNPTAMFRGVREEGEPKWRCYVSRPGRAYDYRTGECRSAWAGEVFLVFVNDDRIIYNWRWEKADPNDADLPEGYASRFDERIR